MGQWQWRISTVYVDNMYTGAARQEGQREPHGEAGSHIAVGNVRSKLSLALQIPMSHRSKLKKGVVEEVSKSDNNQSEKVRGHH